LIGSMMKNFVLPFTESESWSSTLFHQAASNSY